ncbi:MAG: cellulase family glycosylhydrolase [bacterium]|nr:cellulase family glycosylhydrolase [bacterium]
MFKKKNLIRALMILGVGILFIFCYLFIGRSTISEEGTYGVTFSAPYAEQLGLNPQTTLTAILDNLGVRRFRIPAYWSLLEPRLDHWNFQSLDRQIDLIESRKGEIILELGIKSPRWPECWTPEWWNNLDRQKQKERTLLYIDTVMTRYRDRRSIIAWQIENEPHFNYGNCPKPDLSFFKEEVKRARSIDSTRPITTTDSGELSLWMTFGKTIDALGVSTYRVVQSPIIGQWRYWFLPPYFYQRKATLVKAFRPNELYVSEFQMEPWTLKPIEEASLEEQMKTFDLDQMQSNLLYAERMNIDPIDFWGVEWWYWMKEKKDHPEFWETMKTFLDDKRSS